MLIRLSNLAAFCIEIVPKYLVHCSLPSSGRMCQKGLLSDIYTSGSGTNGGTFGLVMCSGKTAVLEKKIWRNNESELHFVFDTVHKRLNNSNYIFYLQF